MAAEQTETRLDNSEAGDDRLPKTYQRPKFRKSPPRPPVLVPLTVNMMRHHSCDSFFFLSVQKEH